MTVIETVRSDGTTIKPFISVKSDLKRDEGTVRLEYMGNHTLAHSTSGRTNDPMGLTIIRDHFGPLTEMHAMKNGVLRTRLLIFGGRQGSSLCSDDVLKYCEDNNIIPLTLPPHTSWKLQPLDVGVFSPYRNAVLTAEEQTLKKWPMGWLDLIFMILKYRTVAMTESNIKASFRATGIVPFQDSFLDSIPKTGTLGSDTEKLLIRGSNRWMRDVLGLAVEEKEEIDERVVDSFFATNEHSGTSSEASQVSETPHPYQHLWKEPTTGTGEDVILVPGNSKTAFVRKLYPELFKRLYDIETMVCECNASTRGDGDVGSGASADIDAIRKEFLSVFSLLEDSNRIFEMVTVTGEKENAGETTKRRTLSERYHNLSTSGEMDGALQSKRLRITNEYR